MSKNCDKNGIVLHGLNFCAQLYDCYILKIITVFCYSYVTYYCLCIYYHFAVVLLPIKDFIFFAFIVSTGYLRWIPWFSIRYAATCREIFGINALRGKLHQLGSQNLQDIFIVG